MSALLAAAPAAPAAPAAGITAGLILLAFAWVVLYGSMRGYDYSFGALVRKLADMVDDIWLVGGKLADALRAMDYFVMARMADGLDELEEQMSRLWYGLTWIVRETGHALEAFGADVQAAIEGIVGGDIPAQVGAATRPLSDAIGAFRKGLRRYVEDGSKPLKWGHNSAKVGGRAIRGRWKNLPIYTLTLEERATCPRSCVN